MDGRNLNNVKSCPHCKGLFMSATDEICSNKICIQKENELIKILKGYLEISPNAQPIEIISNTELDMAFLKRFRNRSNDNFIMTEEEKLETEKKKEQNRLLNDLEKMKLGRRL